MESKGAAEGVLQKAAAQGPEKESTAASSCFRRATAGEEEAATLMDRLRQFKDAPRSDHWVCLKNKVRAAGEYAPGSLMTRQGVSMFGEPKIGPVFQQEAGAKEKMPPAAASSSAESLTTIVY